MIGLYLLTTSQLKKDNTIKFGMSMRLQYRWIDYLSVFSDAKYVYYYELLDDLTRENILDIENEIININKHTRNNNYQTEYFYCDDYDIFHNSIISVLNKRKINYKYNKGHDFDDINYDYNYEFNNKKQVLTLTPRNDQIEIITKSYEYFQKNDKGILVLVCGIGKTLISLWITEKLKSNKIIIGVPNILLLNQWKSTITKIFSDKNILIIKSGVRKDDIEEFIKTLTEPFRMLDDYEAFLKK